MDRSFAHFGIKKEIRELTFSPIREIVRFAENQNNVVPFWFGEPDVSTPDFISKAAKNIAKLKKKLINAHGVSGRSGGALA